MKGYQLFNILSVPEIPAENGLVIPVITTMDLDNNLPGCNESSNQTSDSKFDPTDLYVPTESMPVKGNVKTDSAKHSLTGKSEEKNKNLHTAAKGDKYQGNCEMESEEKPLGESDTIIIIVDEDQESMKAPANATNKRVLEPLLCHQMTPSQV